MKVTPITRYAPPAYPTRGTLDAQPELLHLMPNRWQRNARVLAAVSVLSGVTAIGTLAAPPANKPLCPPPVRVESSHTPVVLGGMRTLSPRQPDLTRITITSIEGTAIPAKDSVLVPISTVANFFGAACKYDAKEATVTVTKGSARLCFTRGSSTAIIGGERVLLPAVVREVNGHLYAPARALAQPLGGVVAWNAKTNEVSFRRAGNDTTLLFTTHQQRHAPAKSPRHKAAAMPTPEHRIAAAARQAQIREFLTWLRAEGIA